VLKGTHPISDQQFNEIFERNHGAAAREYYSGPHIRTSSMTAAVAENALMRGANRRTAAARGCE
jgi:hypothetical protein